jgi:hypothetical protein
MKLDSKKNEIFQSKQERLKTANEIIQEFEKQRDEKSGK